MTHFAAMASFVWFFVIVSFLTYGNCDPIPNTDGSPSLLSKAADEVKTAYHKAADHCVCVNHNCGCCSHLSEPTIHLNSTICANATYLDADYGFSLTVTVDTHTIFNETMSLRNPPPICIGAPWVKDYADVCVRIYDIQAQSTHLHGCVDVEALFKHIRIAKFDLGCFNMRGNEYRRALLNMENEV